MKKYAYVLCIIKIYRPKHATHPLTGNKMSLLSEGQFSVLSMRHLFSENNITKAVKFYNPHSTYKCKLKWNNKNSMQELIIFSVMYAVRNRHKKYLDLILKQIEIDEENNEHMVISLKKMKMIMPFIKERLHPMYQYYIDPDLTGRCIKKGYLKTESSCGILIIGTVLGRS